MATVAHPATAARPSGSSPADRAAARAAALCRATPRIAGAPPAPVVAAAAVAAGTAPAPLTARVRDMLDSRRRERLAARIAALIAAERRSDGTAACGRLRDAEHLLRSGMPLPAPAAHALEAFLDRAESGAYTGRAAELRREAGAACAALGVVTPFA